MSIRSTMMNKQFTVTDLCVLLEVGGWWIVLSMAKAWHAQYYVKIHSYAVYNSDYYLAVVRDLIQSAKLEVVHSLGVCSNQTGVDAQLE